MVYRTFFELADESESLHLETVRDVILAWAITRQGARAANLIDLTGDSGVSELGSGCLIESRTYQGNHGRAWGLRYTNPDSTPGIQWISETTVRQNPEGRVWVSCSLQVGRVDGALSPVQRFASRPGAVKEVLSKFTGRGILPLKPSPFLLETGNVKLLVRLLEFEGRQHPVVFVAPGADGNFTCDYRRLADQLCGLAYVVVGASPAVCSELSEAITSRLSCFDGGVRIYWPGFGPGAFPVDHPLWTKFRIQKLTSSDPKLLASEILNRIAAVSVYTSSQQFVSWNKIAEWQRENAIESAKAHNNQADLLALYEETNTDLANQVRQLKDLLQNKAQEIAKYKNQLESLRSALATRHSGQDSSSQEAAVETVADALVLAEIEFGDKLVFAWNSKSDGEDSPFERPDEVFAALRWLATTYYDSRIGKKTCPDFNHSLRDEVEGWGYRAHQSDNTMNHIKFRDWYHTKFNGEKYALPEHLKSGTTKDARYSIRIGFTWDAPTQRVILGYLGQHQETSAS
jgi:hypothetical protein